MAIPPQAVIPLATGQIETYKVGWKEKDHHMSRLDGIKALSNLAGAMAYEGHRILLDCLMDDDPKIRVAGLFALPSVAIRLMNCSTTFRYCLMIRMHL